MLTRRISRLPCGAGSGDSSGVGHLDLKNFSQVKNANSNRIFRQFIPRELRQGRFLRDDRLGQIKMTARYTSEGVVNARQLVLEVPFR
jgi:hypothetical protein